MENQVSFNTADPNPQSNLTDLDPQNDGKPMSVAAVDHRPQSNLVEADPFDPAALRLDPSEEIVGIRKVLSGVPIRKPKRQEFVRVRPEPEYRLDVAILDLEEDGDSFMVTPELRAELADELKRVTLFTTTNRAGGIFLWPVKLPDATGRRNTWADSSRRGAELAMKEWTRLSSNCPAGQYDLAVASANLPGPEWPDLPLKELLRLAFQDAMISSMDHPAIRRLRGEA
jgi:hypothetical protein